MIRNIADKKFTRGYIPPSPVNGRGAGGEGYTLLEALVALGIFLVVIVPLISNFGGMLKPQLARDRFISTCLLEQESALVISCPGQVPSEKRRQVDGQEWVVEIERTGSDFATWRLITRRGGKQIGEVRFHSWSASR